MSLIREYGKIQFECDECGNTTKTHDKDDFDILKDNAKSDGWKTYKEGNEWKHRCPDC